MIFERYPQYTSKWTSISVRYKSIDLDHRMFRWLNGEKGGRYHYDANNFVEVKFEREEDAILFALVWL